ncbi:MAG: SDR family NAD(P)-dependent oxidoreductase [Gammaproteobacteria bacterium]|nr:SDR family NAD(P)-dependent oxidoreductase [Gammaproteobacteria bacterium]MYB38665.1 SDR family oxidoreductase [Gammaproteobacteria bacterium]
MLEDLRLDGRSAIVTGGGRGLGRAMAKALAKAGANVLVAARTQAQVDEAVAEIRSEGGNALAHTADVTSSAQVDAMVDACVREFGAIDIMVANAGGGGVQGDWPFWEYPDDAFETVLATNLKSNFYCGRAAARYMVERGEGGVIINTSSGTALRGNRSFAYPTAKGGQISLTKSMATMLGPEGIRVNVIVPGFVAQQPARDEREAATRKQRGARIPVRRIGEWWELGPLAVYLASDASRYVTGQMFIIDGGGLAGGIGPTGFVPEHAGEAEGAG